MNQEPTPNVREIGFEHSRDFVPILEQLGVSLLLTTYQSGHLVAIGVHRGQVRLSLHRFEHAMGMTRSNDWLAVGTRNQVWFLQSVPDLAANMAPAGTFDGGYVARRSHFTGQIDCHELGYDGQRVWVVNSLFSCLATIDEHASFVPQWKPPFISRLAPEDRCHLNGLAMVDGRPRYVTVVSPSDEAEGWRPTKDRGGCVLEVPSGRTVVDGLAMPHSPRWHDGRLWVLNSGHGELGCIDPEKGVYQGVERVPGYTRGLALHGPAAFVGLSKIRQTSTFGGLPIAERRAELRCGVAIVNLQSGKSLAYLTFPQGIDEVFDVHVLPNIRTPFISGPHPTDDGMSAVWVMPPTRL
jgi:uncharacterized protein (TIGR03032 family)